MERRLAAILAADLVGYTRLVGDDEAGTVDRLRNLREQVLAPIIARHKGRIVKLMGDGMLLEFASVVDAVACAKTWQEDMARHQADVDASRRLCFRIGVHIGDIIAEGDDILGDGVNIAARLEGVAEPGGVCLSSDAYRQVRGKIDAACEDLGLRQVKNVAEPIQVYRLALDRTPPPSGGVGEQPSASSDKPTIAVLPFTNLSGDPEQEYFSDGICEDIITELSRFHSVLVIARNSSFSYKGRSPRIQDVGRELGVRYVLEGSVRKLENRLRVTAQLVEAPSGVHLWAERYDRDAGEVFAVQDELVRTVVSTVAGRIDEAGKSRARRLSAAGLDAYDLYLRALVAQDKNTPESYQEADLLLQQAVRLDPDFALAHHHLSLVKYIQWFGHWTRDRETAFSESVALAERALALDNTSSGFHAHYGLLLMGRFEHEEAREHFKRAIQLNPNDAKARGLYGFFLTSTHELDEAILMFDWALRLNPLAPDWINWLRGIAYYTARRYADAIRSLKTIHAPMNEVRGWLAACYAQSGKLDQARASLDAFLGTAKVEMAECPPRRLAAWRSFWRDSIPYTHAEDEAHLLDGLRAAGLED